MENNTAIGIRIDPEDTCEMPCNRLALTIGIAGEIDFIRVFRIFSERANKVAFSAYIDIFGGERIFHVNAKLAFRQVAQVPH